MRESAWASRRLGEVVAEAGGLLQTGPFGSQLHAYEYADNGIPVVMPQDIPNGVIDVRAVARVAELTAQRLRRHRLQAGDVVFSRRGDLSRCALVEASQTGWLCGTGCLLLRPNRSPLSGAWVSRIYRHHTIQSRIAGLAVGTTMANLNTGILARLEIPGPPLTEQRQIAAILDTIDDAIRKTEQIIAKLKQVKQGLLHDLLTRGIDDNGELRDPERHPEQFKDSVLGRIPRGWEVVVLGTVVPRAVYGISESLDGGPGTPVLRMMNFKDGEADLSELKFSRSKGARELLLQSGDVLFNRTNSIDHVGRTGIWRGQIDVASFASYLVRLDPDLERLRADFLNRWLNWEATQLQIRRFATPGVHQVNINPTNLRRTLAALPTSLAEQDRAIASMAALDARLAQESAQLGKLRLTRQGLMEDLLTGRVRVTKLLESAAE